MKFGLMSGHCGSYECQRDGWKQFTFEDGFTVYEGIKNRHIKLRAMQLAEKEGLEVIDVNPLPNDYSLVERVQMIDSYVDEYGEDFRLIEIHNNASPGHNASGFEVFSTKRNNKSDELAEIMLQEIENQFPQLRNRGHKESNWYIIDKMKSYGILVEFCFFDYRPDVDLVLSSAGIHKCATSIINTIKQCEK